MTSGMDGMDGSRMAVGWHGFVKIFENKYGKMHLLSFTIIYYHLLSFIIIYCHSLSFIIIRYILLFGINMYQSIFVLSATSAQHWNETLAPGTSLPLGAFNVIAGDFSGVGKCPCHLIVAIIDHIPNGWVM